VRAETNPTASVFWNGAEAPASSVASASCYGSAKNVLVLAVVKAELKLIQIERQVFLTYVVIRADDSALQERPEILDIVRMDLSANVLLCPVIDGFVATNVIGHSLAITRALIGRDQFNLVRDGFVNEAVRVSIEVSSMILQTTLPLREIAPMTVVLPVLAAPPP